MIINTEHVKQGYELVEEFAAAWMRCDNMNTPFCHFCGNHGRWTDDEAIVEHNGACIVLKAERWLTNG